jgi:hypothetical protein
MFVWAFATITEGLQRHQPEMHAACQRWFKLANDYARLARVLARDYPKLDPRPPADLGPGLCQVALPFSARQD